MFITQILAFGSVMTVTAMIVALQYYSFPHILVVAAPQGIAGGTGLAAVLTIGQVFTCARVDGGHLEALHSRHRITVHPPRPVSDSGLAVLLQLSGKPRAMHIRCGDSWKISFRRRPFMRAVVTRDGENIVITVGQKWPYLMPDLGSGRPVAERVAAAVINPQGAAA
jgi:hypothetical protein